MQKTAMFYLQNNVSKLKNVFFSTVVIAKLEGGGIYGKHPPLTTRVCMVTKCLKFLVCLTDVLPESKTKNVINDIVTGGRPITSS